MKQTLARIASTISALALLGASFAFVAPASDAAAVTIGCTLTYPTIRTTTAVTTPYGASPNAADIITVKVINNSSTTNCYDGVLTVTPRAGMGFTSFVNVPIGWLCIAPGPGLAGNVVCTIPTVAKASSTTLRVRYDKLEGQAVTGAASSTLEFDTCQSNVGLSAICVV